MAVLTIRNLDERVKDRLRLRAARHGRSMEAEARAILAESVSARTADEIDLAEAIRRRFVPIGGVEFDPHPPVAAPEPPGFE